MTIVIGITLLTHIRILKMMNSFKNWYVSNQDAITWFLIGWLAFALLDNLIQGDYIWAAVTAVLLWLNYTLRKVRLQ
jgi:hypothetical protein